MLTIYKRIAPFYRDFFDPPPRESALQPEDKSEPKFSGAVSPVTPGKVRFHEEVRVRNIKVKGKNRPLSTMYEDDDDEDDNDQITFGDFEAAVHREDFEEDLDEATSSFKLSEEGHFEDDEDEDGSDDGDGRDTIARLKDDLFADDKEKEPRTSLSYFHQMATFIH